MKKFYQDVRKESSDRRRERILLNEDLPKLKEMSPDFLLEEDDEMPPDDSPDYEEEDATFTTPLGSSNGSPSWLAGSPPLRPSNGSPSWLAGSPPLLPSTPPSPIPFPDLGPLDNLITFMDDLEGRKTKKPRKPLSDDARRKKNIRDRNYRRRRNDKEAHALQTRIGAEAARLRDYFDNLPELGTATEDELAQLVQDYDQTRTGVEDDEQAWTEDDYALDPALQITDLPPLQPIVGGPPRTDNRRKNDTLALFKGYLYANRIYKELLEVSRWDESMLTLKTRMYKAIQRFKDVFEDARTSKDPTTRPGEELVFSYPRTSRRVHKYVFVKYKGGHKVDPLKKLLDATLDVHQKRIEAAFARNSYAVFDGRTETVVSATPAKAPVAREVHVNRDGYLRLLRTKVRAMHAYECRD
jgi:hypothetical protein